MIKTLHRKKPLVLVELNEINFSVVKDYLLAEPLLFPSLQKLIESSMVHTEAELNYQDIEPWIQWVSVHTGLSYGQHGVFRLGDISGSGVPQIYEALECLGVSVGCISPMNAENRLKSPAYFLPDPWTSTPSDGSWWSRILTEAISQAVNDNAKSKLSVTSVLALALGIVRFARPVNYLKYLSLVARAKRAPWGKALFLDLLLHDLHIRLFRSKQPEFSSIFLNAGAHIQHHYFLNSDPIKSKLSIRNPDWYVAASDDPVKEMLSFYDRIIGDYLAFDDVEVIVATGLSQQPYERLKYYYRLSDHAHFLDQVGVDFIAVHPRMTRDFLVEFANASSMQNGVARLRSLRVEQDDVPLFAEIEERVDSAFVTLTYPHEITSATTFLNDSGRFNLLPQVAFVALKNGMHRSEGYAFFTPGAASYAPSERQHVKSLYFSIMSYFTDSTVGSFTSTANSTQTPHPAND